ncbi:MAG: dephospho-CoA kinase [Acidimicrobiia bacterium]|nr:dephospho-CoA kinase [Acidimicrobiia bacterium]
MRAEGNTDQPLRLVISGGIGSGKSTVLAILAELGAVIIEADRLGHEVLEPGGAAHGAVADQWPAVVDGDRIDRTLLAAVVFSDPEQLDTLERLTHPHIRFAIQELVDRNPDRDIAVELPVRSNLVGPGWSRVVVVAPVEERLDRAVARGFAEGDVARRMALQPSDAEWAESADHIIENAGSLGDLRRAVRKLWDELHADAAG